MSWLAYLLAPWRNATTTAAALARIETAVHTIPADIDHLETLMADVSALLNEVADGLSGPLATSINELIAERDALAAQNAALTGEDVAESEAAGRVKSAFDAVASKFTATPEVPDVEPLPEPEAPAEGTEQV